MLPDPPVPIGTRFEVGLPGKWIVTFDRPIVPPGPTDPLKWDVLIAGVPIPGGTADIIAGEAVQGNLVFAGNEDSIEYLGQPPPLRAAQGPPLQPFLIPAVP